MYLKYLAVEGFKSFPEWNGLELLPGVNVLVGLNGTGKSNLTDAMSWVLGEDDRTALRAEGAAALVFAGSDELVAADIARVTVVLDERPSGRLEDGGRLPLGQLKHGQQATHTGVCPPGALTITRESARAGVDRFLIDDRPSSRDDVRAALTAAGVAFPPVATIRQGELDRLLVLGPGDRARAIERMAGIPELTHRLRTIDAEAAERRLQSERLEGEHVEASAQVGALRNAVVALGRARSLQSEIDDLRAAAVTRAIAGLSTSVGRGAEDAARVTGDILRVLGLAATGDALGSTVAEGVDDVTLGHTLDERLAALTALGPGDSFGARALATAAAHLDSIEADLLRLSSSLTALERERQTLMAEASAAFLAATDRIDDRFRRYYALLAPDGEAALRVVPDDEDGHPGVEVIVRPPGKILDRIDALSGGERSLAALSFALALFEEAPARFFILDEVEPALDDSNIRRLQSVLDLVADRRQLLVVSHQQRAKETGDVVFGVERNLDGASQVKFRYEPRSNRLEVFRRTWTADHLRKAGTEEGAKRVRPDRGQRSVGTAGSPTQAVFAELFGPASGATRTAFHDDGTFRGIWDAMNDETEDAPDRPEDDPPPKTCC